MNKQTLEELVYEKDLKVTNNKLIQLYKHKQSNKYLLKRELKEYSLEVYNRLLYLSHKNLIQIYDIYEQDGTLIVWEEYFPSQTLWDVMYNTKLTNKQIKNISLQLCDGLEALHSQNIIHRDIKPENILINDSGLIKLIDYDIARVYISDSTNDTTMLGTIGYASPEQYGISQSTIKSDIYSLGVLINILLIGRHITDECCKGIKGKIVQKCTRLEVAKRYKNIVSLKRDILMFF